jgi:integrase
MNRLRFQRDVDSLKPKADRYEVYFDNPTGLGVRVSPPSRRYPEGRKVYFMFYRTKAGRFRRYSFGDCENWTLNEPRKGDPRKSIKNEVAAIKTKVGADRDPQAEKLAEREAEKARAAQRRKGIPDSRRLSKAIDAFLADKDVAKKKAVAQKAAHLKKDLLKVIGDVDILTIGRADIEKAIAAKVDKGALVSANRVLAHSKTLFKWLLAKRIIEADPTAGIAKALAVEEVRNRFLEKGEIKTFWSACEKVSAPYGQLFRFALLTAARRNECGFMEWSEFDPAENVWIIPAKKVKGGRDHLLPLSTLAAEIVKGQPKVEGSPYVFARADGGAPNAWSAATEALNVACGFKRMDDENAPGSWLSPHDLRRTCVEGLDSLGVVPFIVDRVLNHSQGKLKKSYRRWQYISEKRAALEAWADRVAELVA